MSKSVTEIRKSMAEQGFGQEQIELFGKLYTSWRRQEKSRLDWSKIRTPSEDAILDYEELPKVTEKRTTKLLSKLAVCRLNGGLGTSMGCVGPKSAIEVRGGQSFLDLIVTQIHHLNEKHGSQVPLVLMNSFNTEQDTAKIIKKYEDDVTIHTFTQHEFPRLRRDSFQPMNRKKHGDAVSYPPGHGDFFDSIHKSGVLEDLIAEGKEFMFVANADNLGASVDLTILSEMERSKAPFLMEVTAKTRADIKGGTLVKSGHNGLRLLEIAQVPKENVEEFKSVKTFKIFNTNNIWINLKALKEKLDNGGLELEVIVNKKSVNQLPVIQLETAIGGAINNFEGARAIKVPRSRFLPVKKTDDLLLVQSNLFVLKDGVLVRNPERQFAGLPLIRLGPYFKNFDDYQQRFETIPDILELDLLTVVGDVTFGSHITLRGNVILVCEQGGLRLPDGATLENKVLTGTIKMGEL